MYVNLLVDTRVCEPGALYWVLGTLACFLLIKLHVPLLHKTLPPCYRTPDATSPHALLVHRLPRNGLKPPLATFIPKTCR